MVPLRSVQETVPGEIDPMRQPTGHLGYRHTGRNQEMCQLKHSGTVEMDHTNAIVANPYCHNHLGAIAQLGERLLCKQEVASSILAGSTG